jgi:phage shock protein A
MGKITPLFGRKAGVPMLDGEEPVLTGLIGDMTAHLITAKNQVTDSQKAERRLAKQAEVAARAADAWEQRAMAAVRAGDDVVARDALLRKRQHQQDNERGRAAEQDQHRQTAALTRALVALNLRIEETKHKRNAVVARAERADALPVLEQEAARPVANVDADDADEMLKRLEAKMTDIETELELSDEAIANLAREAGDELRTRDELARLKREASDPALSASKPLAKTVPNDAQSPRLSPSQAAGVSGPQRTKR